MYQVLYAIYRLIDILSWLIVVQAVLTWFPNETTRKAYNAISVLTDPVVEPIRNFSRRYNDGPVDFSPFFALIILSMINRLIIGLM